MIKGIFPTNSGCVITDSNGRRWWWNYAGKGHWEAESLKPSRKDFWYRVKANEVPDDVRLAARLEAAA